MAINVYWACLEDEWLRAEKPIPLSKLFYDNEIYDISFKVKYFGFQVSGQVLEHGSVRFQGALNS